MMITKNYQRQILQILPFGIIWVVFASVYSFLEFGMIGSLDRYPTTGNVYDFGTSMRYAVVGSFVMGLLQGWVEVVWLRRRFASKALWVKISLKSFFYLVFIILFLGGITLVANSALLETSLFDSEVLSTFQNFITSFAFWSILIYISVTLSIALVFSEITEYFGQDTFYNFLLGKYHKPNKEIRIFMFLDMKSSTTIAEELGHEKYFELIKKYYADMTLPIVETSGEIYQYVGDEIVVSWLAKNGLLKNNCIECFHRILEMIGKHSEYYKKTFGVVPEFKAGYHIGEVTSGEIGILKKDIIYTGDVLNTTARIQAECNNYRAKALISEDLLKKLPSKSSFLFTEIGGLKLRGKRESVKLFRIDF